MFRSMKLTNKTRQGQRDPAVSSRFPYLTLLPSLFLVTPLFADLHPAGKVSAPAAAANANSGSAKPLFKSHIVTPETVGHAVDIDVDLKGAGKLYLVVTDGGNDFAADWSAWVEPRISGDYGQKKLTEIPWVRAEAG